MLITTQQINEHTALLYAEKYGIVAYKVKYSTMVYYEKYPNEGKFKHTINLTTMNETVKHLYQRKHNKLINMK